MDDTAKSDGEQRRVAISGAGIVAPGAIGVEAFRDQLRSGVSATGPITRFDTAGLSAHSAALVSGFNAKQFIAPMKLRRMNGLSKLAVSACRMALIDSSHTVFPSAGAVGVSIGSTFGPVETSAEYLREYVEKGASLAPPQLFAESVANAPGSHIAIELGLQGFNLTFTQRESSSLAALMFACGQLVKGTVQAAISGGVEEINEITFSVLDRIGALAHADGGLTESSRPFDRSRNGMMVGEGGAVFHLQLPEDATRAHAFVSGFGIGRDATASISDWGDGAASAASAMQRAVDDAGLELGEIDAVVASANSSVRADRLEARALRSLFGRDIPPVVAPKAYFGEYAAAGALQIAVAVLMIAGQELFSTPGFESSEPGLELPVGTSRRDANLRHVLVSSLSAGGGIVSAVFSREAA